VYDAIVLAGGAARRLDGVAKPQLQIGGRTLLDRVVGAVPAAGAVIVVGPRQPVTRSVTWCREDPPGGGPVAALAAAVPLTGAPTVVVLAADLPSVTPAVALLVAALGPTADVALLVDASGRANHLAAVWRRSALVAALARLPAAHGAAMRTLLDGVEVVRVVDEQGWGRDVDTWDDVAAAQTEQLDREDR
jgi:molybdopterin-guanine dinucleotide biosynthesis protein A